MLIEVWHFLFFQQNAYYGLKWYYKLQPVSQQDFFFFFTETQYLVSSQETLNQSEKIPHLLLKRLKSISE